MDNTTQEPVPFLLSVEENIGYGLREDNLSKHNIIKAAKAENAHEVTISLPQATSALDAFSERLVQDALNLLMKGRTTLVIAHRLSTVQNSHQIAHSSNGQTAELGTHFDLLGKGAICFISRHPKTDIEYY